ncbi:MAG: hypothetical protein ACRDL7_02365 [Gaiellaceae bacterium]
MPNHHWNNFDHPLQNPNLDLRHDEEDWVELDHVVVGRKEPQNLVRAKAFGALPGAPELSLVEQTKVVKSGAVLRLIVKMERKLEWAERQALVAEPPRVDAKRLHPSETEVKELRVG